MSQKVSLLLDSQLDVKDVAHVLEDLGKDDLLRDRFTNHMSLRLMEHAHHHDLEAGEDPVF